MNRKKKTKQQVTFPYKTKNVFHYNSLWNAVPSEDTVNMNLLLLQPLCVFFVFFFFPRSYHPLLHEESTKEKSCLPFFINSHRSLFCNTNKFTLCRSHINYAVRENAAVVERKEGENERFTFCCSFVEYSYPIVSDAFGRRLFQGVSAASYLWSC